MEQTVSLQRNTSRSDTIAERFFASGPELKRKVQIYEYQFDFSAQDVFPLLCPTREADWIKGWNSDLLFTTSGYAEDMCIFTTPPENSIGPGVWFFTEYLMDRRVAILRIIENSLAEHIAIDLIAGQEAKCKGIWTLTFTALNDAGNQLIDEMPAEDPAFYDVLKGINYFLKTGELQPEA